MNTKHHQISISHLVLLPQDGLLLGNGDLSVSIYQAADEIRFRFGKGDVWDRRIDFSRDAKPAHINEVRKGIEEEGWKCGPYGGPVEATNGSSDEDRMREICQGCPPSYSEFPYPCPKPVGELAMRLPSDAQGLEITQSLDIEKAEVSLECRWKGGLRLSVLCFVGGVDNVLCVDWKLQGWTETTRSTGDFYGVGPAQPIWFRLYRWKDPEIVEAKNDHFAQHRYPGVPLVSAPTATPLPLPSVVSENDRLSIVQRFPGDTVFPDGFECVMAPVSAEGLLIEQIDTGTRGTALLHLMPDSLEGSLAIGVATSSDSMGPRATLEQMASNNISHWQTSSRHAADTFWCRSLVSLADSRLENLWYASLHAKRCIYRSDTVPPGLFLPSTITDYSIWHGDYHTNYNLQSIFLGDFASNHIDLGDAYFQAMEFFLPIGRKIARNYYGCRGIFIQLSGYPTHPVDDPLGAVPMGRMAYMTGWAANMYWWRYQYTQDRAWLSETGYPVIRDCALFYTDFLQREPDGLFHAFPSNQGEDGFSGNPEDFRDRPQIIRHARYCLKIAAQAALALGTDTELADTWKGMVTDLAPDAGNLDENLPPEFYAFDGAVIVKDAAAKPLYLDPESESYRWYPGKLGFNIIQTLRTGQFLPDRDFLPTADLLDRWTHENGLMWAMSVGNYGHVGAWTESLGITGAIQELLLQSWEGVVRLFPGFPLSSDASFESLRTEGAFLVSAKRENGIVEYIEISSEAGGEFQLENPWPNDCPIIRLENGASTEATLTSDGTLVIPTIAGEKYRLEFTAKA